MQRLLPVALLFAVLVASCARRDLNSKCEWPSEAPFALDLSKLAQQRHLASDAQFAEDLAIHYADVKDGLHSGHFEGAQAYAQTRDQCMAGLFGTIATTHGVSQDQVRALLTYRRADLDLAVILSFAVLYGLASLIVTRRIWMRFPREDGLARGVLANLFASFLVSTASLLLGEVWSDVAEGLRVSTSHMSYRASRIPWSQHHAGLFAAGIVLFWVIAATQYRFSTIESQKIKSKLALNLTVSAGNPR